MEGTMITQLRFALLPLGLACAVVACGGSGGGSGGSLPTAPSTPVSQTAKGVFTIRIPLTQQAMRKRPEYVSPATQSVSFQVSPNPVQVVALGTSSPDCSQSGGYNVCTANFDAPIGENMMAVQTFASTNGTGPVLSMNSIQIDIIAGQVNPVNVILNGVVNTLTLALLPTSVTYGTPSSVQATWEAIDASGYTIVGPGSFVDGSGNPLAPALSSSDSTDFAITPLPQSSPGWTIGYDGTATTSPTLTLSAPGASPAISSVESTLTVITPISASPSPLDVGETGPQTIYVTEAGYRGNYTVSSDATKVVSVTSPVTATANTTPITVSVNAAGTAHVTITDSTGQSTTVTVVVTLTPVTISLAGPPLTGEPW
jgi:hypothetical protein